MDNSAKKRGPFMSFEFPNAVNMIAARLAKLDVVAFVTNNNLIIFDWVFTTFAWDGC